MSEDAKKSYWSLLELAELSKQTKEVEIKGKLVLIRKLPASVMEQSENKVLTTMVKGLLEPKMTEEEFRNAPLEVVHEIVKAINEFSGLGMDKAEKN